MKINKNMIKAICANNTVLFAQELNMHKKSGNKFLHYGETPLTLILKNCQTSSHVGSFINLLFTSVYGQLNLSNASGEFPLQIACDKGFIRVAIGLIQKGANPLLCKKNLLHMKLGEKILINELIKTYVASYCNFLECCRNQQPENVSKKEMPYFKFNLEKIIDIYLKKGYLRFVKKDKDRKDVFMVLSDSSLKITRYMGSIRKKYAAKALLFFYNRFCMEKKDCDVLNTKKIVSRHMDKLKWIISRKIRKNDMSRKMLACSQKGKFMDVKIFTKT